MSPEEWDRRAAAIRAKWKSLVENEYSDSKYWTDRGQSGSNADYACDEEIMRLGPRPKS
jgi:hypothetical protein